MTKGAAKAGTGGLITAYAGALGCICLAPGGDGTAVSPSPPTARDVHHILTECSLSNENALSLLPQQRQRLRWEKVLFLITFPQRLPKWVANEDV